jgi:hypothetical protein
LDFVPFWIAHTEQEIECSCMTTQQKITAIQAIVTEALVIEAMNTALKDDLAIIFAANSSRPAAGNLPAAQNVRRKRRKN